MDLIFWKFWGVQFFNLFNTKLLQLTKLLEQLISQPFVNVSWILTDDHTTSYTPDGYSQKNGKWKTLAFDTTNVADLPLAFYILQVNTLERHGKLFKTDEMIDKSTYANYQTILWFKMVSPWSP